MGVTERRLRRVHGREEGAPAWWPPDEDPLAPARGCIVAALMVLVLFVFVLLTLALVSGRL